MDIIISLESLAVGFYVTLSTRDLSQNLAKQRGFSLTNKESEIEDSGKGAFARCGFAKGQVVVSHSPCCISIQSLLCVACAGAGAYIYKSIRKWPGRAHTTQRWDLVTIEAQELMLN
jgi:hypothetical protein